MFCCDLNITVTASNVLIEQVNVASLLNCLFKMATGSTSPEQNSSPTPPYAISLYALITPLLTGLMSIYRLLQIRNIAFTCVQQTGLFRLHGHL